MDFFQPAYLYILVSLYAIGTMLCQKPEDNNERIIYYLNKILIDYEIKYSYGEDLFFYDIYC